jgi:MHS family proline/betaine transporter-like MFS transporter
MLAVYRKGSNVFMNHQKKSIFISLLCNLFHYYAFSIYAFSSVILAPNFFHTQSEQLTKILGLVTFSMTFFLKPLGSVILGHIGDKYGRKTALNFSLLAITLATTGIGLIPSFAQIGWLSGVLLITCLVIQGTCLGGQYTGAIIYIQEHTKKEYAAFACGLMISIGFFGTLLGTAISFFFYNIHELGWQWRIPFLLSSLIGLTLYHFAKNMKETPLFTENIDKTQKKTIQFVEIIKNFKKPLFSAIFISSIPVSLFYIATVYLLNFYMDEKVIGESIGPLGFVCLAQIACMVLSPSLGFVADVLGRERQLKLTSLLLIISPLFIFYYLSIFNSFTTLIIVMVIFSILTSLYAGAIPAYLTESFPVIGRYSGMGLGISIGEGLLGGSSTMICFALGQFFESKLAPAYYVMFLGVLSLVGILLAKKDVPYNKLDQKNDLPSKDKYAISS